MVDALMMHILYVNGRRQPIQYDYRKSNLRCIVVKCTNYI